MISLRPPPRRAPQTRAAFKREGTIVFSLMATMKVAAGRAYWRLNAANSCITTAVPWSRVSEADAAATISGIEEYSDGRDRDSSQSHHCRGTDYQSRS